MAEVVVSVVEGDETTERVITEAGPLEEAVDADINAFDKYFQQVLKNEPLSRSERAIIKTYLHFKTLGGSGGSAL